MEGTPPPKFPFNWVYFSLLFGILFSLTIFNFLTIDPISSSRIFFLLYSLGQSFLEIGLMICCAWLIQKYLPKVFLPIFIGLTFLYFLTHIIDFIMARILDMTFLDTIDFVLDESFENFIEMLHASGIPLMIWIAMGIGILLMPVLGYGIYLLTGKLSRKRPIFMRQNAFLQGLFCLPIALFIWDFSASGIINANDYNSYLKSLPWKKTFLQPKSIWLTVNYPPKKLQKEELVLEKVEKITFTPPHRPNIYLFIIESFREDFVNDKNSPNLEKFKQENIHFDLSLSGGNGTHLSWYSIFHANFPLYWSEAKNSSRSEGSIPLKILKKLGYKIHVYSSAQLSYYGMEELIFGNNRKLVDHFHLFPHYYPVKACDSDSQTITKFQEYLSKQSPEGNIHIFFWDSTHFDYSWPKDFPLKFKPISNDFSYFKAHHSDQDIEMIKNRYRNSVHFVDHLFGKFITSLKNQQAYEDAVIVVTGDHGEEFMEHGHMFHCSELVKEQTHVPLYYKFGKMMDRTIPNTALASHMEIFPSIFDYIFGENILSDLLEGDSIFEKSKWAYTLTARYNASRTPYEFFLHNGKYKLIARFKNRKNIFGSKELQIIGLKDQNEQNIVKNPQETPSFVWQEFKEAFDVIFKAGDSSQPKTP
ncbi:MAG: sulfatase-like hydrolase/transferase [Chlamydiota bacterium]